MLTAYSFCFLHRKDELAAFALRPAKLNYLCHPLFPKFRVKRSWSVKLAANICSTFFDNQIFP